jgi:hypothetical protein
MRPVRTLLSLACVALVGVAAAGCGLQAPAPGMASAKARGALAARGTWEEAVVLEDFDTIENSYDHYGPVNHPFFDTLDFTPVKTAKSGSTVLEILAANRPKPRKGILLTEDVEEDGSFERGEEEKKELAEQVKVSFSWGNNGAATNDPCIYAEVAFVFHSKRLNRKALAYAWTNRYCPGTVLAGQIGAGDDTIPMRIICLQQGQGLGQQCSEGALNQIGLLSVERDFAADVRWAWAESTKLTEPGAVTTAAQAGCVTTATPPRQFVVGADGKAIANTDLTGITALGFGAEITKGVCSHAIVDDVAVQKLWPTR